MIRNLKADLRTLEWRDLAEAVSLAGGMLCMALWLVIFSGNLPQ